MIDPTGDFYKLKYISTLLAFLVFWLFHLVYKQNFKLNYYQILIYATFAILMPIYGLLVTVLNTGALKLNDTSYLGFSVFLLSLFPVIFTEPKLFLKTFILALRVLSWITVAILISFITNADSLGIAQFFIDRQSMFVGFREYAGIQTYFLYFTASPLLIILVAHDSYMVYNKRSFNNVLLLLLSITSIFLTGTRFNMLMAIVVLPTIIAVYKFSLRKIGVYIILFLCFIFLLFQSSFISSFFNSNDNSNSVKVGYLETYINIFKQPEALILGQGFSAYDSSVLFKNMLSKFDNEGVKTELTCIELFRVFGVVFGGFFNLILFSMPIFLYNKFRELNFLIIGLVFYLISSLLNPYIFSTNGVLVFLFVIVLLQSNFNNISSLVKISSYD